MTVSDVQIPEAIYKQLSHKKNISYEDIIEVYENSFEFEPVNMKAGDLVDVLKKELQHG